MKKYIKMIDLNKIKPNETGKYSENLYYFLMKNKNCDKVYYCLDKDEQFDINKINLQRVKIGYLDKNDGELFFGKSLFNIVIEKNKEIYCIDLCYYNIIDITYEFWNKYIEIGRCIYGCDRWIQNDENKYTYISDTHRKCNWCGKEEKLIEKTYTRKEWE